jgi:cholinesterase
MSTLSSSDIAKANLTAIGVAAFNDADQVGDVFSEDCLTINVWTKPQTGDPKKAVMIWIYGGGLNQGSSDDLQNTGQYLVEQEDVIVVSFK